MKKIVVVGSLNLDLFIEVDRLPVPGETILSKQVRKGLGGKGANQAVAAARLGAPTTMVGAVGSDVYGANFLERMKKEHLDTMAVRLLDDVSTGVAYISVDRSGANSIVVDMGANAFVSPDMVADSLETYVDDSAIVLLQMEIPIETVIFTAEIAKKKGALVVLNPAPALPLPDYAYKYIDVLTPNEHELAVLAGINCFDPDSDWMRSPSALLQKGVGSVIVTKGSEGAYLFQNDKKVIHKAVGIADVKDTTGAGDCFNGALVSSLASESRLEDAVEFAVNAAAFSVQNHGTMDSYPFLSDLRPGVNPIIKDAE